jgi:glycosyltransferase involved in cell wall biosynthesis
MFSLRVLWVSVSPLRGSSFSVVTDSILKRLGLMHEVYCLGLDYYGTPLQMENYTLAQFTDFRQLEDYLQTLKPDVTVVYHAPLFLSRINPHLDKVKASSKLILYVPIEGYPLTVDTSFFEKADLILVPSKFSQECLAKEGFKSEILPHAVDSEIFKPLKPLEEKYAEANPFKFGTVASMVLRKMITCIVDAYATALSRGMKNTEYCLTASTYDATPWDADVNVYARKMGVPIKISRTAFLNLPVTHQTIASFYNQIHLHCLAASESFGLIHLESMSCGVVPLTIKYGGALETVGDCGLYVSPKAFIATSMGRFAIPDTEELAEKMLWARQNPDKLEKLAEKTVERAKTFTWEKTVGKLERLILV